MAKKTTSKATTNKRKSNNSRKKQRNSRQRRNIIIALAAAFVVIAASAVVAVFAAGTKYTMRRGTFDVGMVKAKSYSQTSVAKLAESASTSVDTGQGCRDAWNKQSKANVSYSYFCFRDGDEKGGWKSQGVTGSGSARSAADGGNKNIVLASWYTEGSPQLAVPTQTSSGANSASRITVINMKTKKYRHVELAKPCTKSGNKLCKLNSHAGGVAWAGNYLYLASTTGMYVFNVNDIFTVSGQPVLVASEYYGLDTKKVKGDYTARISTVSFDSSANQLVTTEFREQDSRYSTKVMRWKLDGTHKLTGSKVTSASSFTLPARHVQGIASYKGGYIAHSSSETASGRSGRGATLLKWRTTSSVSRYLMPHHIESAYMDETQKRVWGLTETGPKSPNRAFMFSYNSDIVF